jgi:hypothetical protein
MSPFHTSIQLVHYLKSTHVPRVAGILETVLIALQEELEEESAITGAPYTI